MDMDLDANIVKALSKQLGIEAHTIIARPLTTESLVEDATQKILISTSKNAKPIAFVLISAIKTPRAIKSGYEKLIALAGAVGSELAKNLLIPDEVAESNGLSYSISRYHKPLSSKKLFKNLDNWYVRRHLIDWVMRVAVATKSPMTKQQAEASFIKPLLVLSEADGLNLKYQNLAKEAVNAIKNQTWQPSFVCAHNDLWRGNVLMSKQHKFLLIDWDGVMLEGYAFYDLVRVADSFKLDGADFKQRLRQYCNMMQCDKTQAKYYLISAFAYLYSDLGGWQYERFLILLNDCMQYLESNS